MIEIIQDVHLYMGPSCITILKANYTYSSDCVILNNATLKTGQRHRWFMIVYDTPP